MNAHCAVGVDIGGTGIKAGLVDLAEGELTERRARLDTPSPATPRALAAGVRELFEMVGAPDVPVGIGFPAAIDRGMALTATNIADEWLYLEVPKVFAEALGRPVAVLNDSDAAGLAEVRFGAGRGVPGTVVVVTLGTGVGTSLFVDGQLVPNIELGGLPVRGKPAAARVANSVRKRKRIPWATWAADLELYVRALDAVTWPNRIIIGGGVSSQAGRFLPLINCRPSLVPARLRNDAGIVGAALYAAERVQPAV